MPRVGSYSDLEGQMPLLKLAVQLPREAMMTVALMPTPIVVLTASLLYNVGVI